MRRWFLRAALVACATPLAAQTTTLAPGVLQYGSANCLGFNCYGSADPTAGANLTDLAAGASTVGTTSFAPGYPGAPAAGAVAGTDHLYVGATQTGFNDGYSNYSGRVHGPQVFTLDYNALVPPGIGFTSLTLGIMTDDFEFPAYGNPFTARINGTVDAGLSALLNKLDETGARARFVTYGLDATLLPASNVLTLSIDEGGTGGDGWAVDFLTLGVPGFSPPVVIPEPSPLLLAGAGLTTLAAAARRRRA